MITPNSNKPFTFYTALLFIFPAIYAIFLHQYTFAFWLALLTFISLLNHNRPYCITPHYDFIDISDRTSFHCHHSIHHFIPYIPFLCSVISYMTISYFIIIPFTHSVHTKCFIHSSFHIVTSITMLHLLHLK